MKKKYLLALIPTLALCACGNSSKEIKNINIICAQGAPAVAFYKHALSDDFLSANAASVKSQLTSKSDYSVVVVDTLSGVDAISNGAPYKIAATITFGNFYLAATGNDDNATLDVGDKICVFNRGAVSDKVFHYIYGDSYDNDIVWASDATQAKAFLETGKDLSNNELDYVFIAQPALFAAQQNNPNATVYDNIQEKYLEKTGGKRLIQATVFVKENLNKEVCNEFLSTLKTDIEEGIATPTLIKDELAKLGNVQEQVTRFGVAGPVAMNVTKQNNGMGLGFAYARDIKEEIDQSLTLYEHSQTTEEMYY